MKKFLIITFLLSAIFLIPFFRAEASNPIKILLVPGHDDEVWGSQYGNIKEADMNLVVATQIYDLLQEDKRFEVHITREKRGYTKEFTDYFASSRDAISVFKENAKKIMQSKIISGFFIQKENVPHHNVNQDIALKLYGFNKWANENKMDAVIHLHFNDYPRKNKWTLGKYKGFTIYMPDSQFANWKESGQLAADIYIQLRKKYSTSTYPPETGGLISDQKLIAIGANNSLDASVRTVLVEYGYIYEKKFRTKKTREQAYKDMASLTFAGIKNYFFPKL